MTDRTLYLHFTLRNNLLWTRKPSAPWFDSSTSLSPGFTGNQPSRLDINVANGDTLTLRLGKSMADWTFWNNDNPKHRFGKDTPLSIDNAIGKGDARKTLGTKLGRFEIVECDKVKVVLKHIESENKNACKFDLHIMNISAGKETRLIIDPMLNNDGAGEDP